jgi:transketolase
VLAERGFFPRELLATFYANGSHLAGHVTSHGVPGVDVSTGSLGHGLSIAAGMALAGLKDHRDYRVFCVLSDGECDEGSTWEAVLFAPHHNLANLVAIVDYNKIQSLGRVEEVLALEPLADKWRAFGWATEEIDGHDVAAVREALERVPFDTARPSCLIAHTVKGKGVSFMEDDLLWHYRYPHDDEYERARSELNS